MTNAFDSMDLNTAYEIAGAILRLMTKFSPKPLKWSKPTMPVSPKS